jgi:hypothetical protein
MFIAIAALVIVAATLAIHRFVDSFVLATAHQLVLLAAVVGIFIWLQ